MLSQMSGLNRIGLSGHWNRASVATGICLTTWRVHVNSGSLSGVLH